jgi:hypothetical protein
LEAWPKTFEHEARAFVGRPVLNWRSIMKMLPAFERKIGKYQKVQTQFLTNANKCLLEGIVAGE